MMLIHPLMMLSSAYNWCNYKTFREKVQPAIFAFVFLYFLTFGRKTVSRSIRQNHVHIEAAVEFCSFWFAHLFS